jgi:hypothetical protein
VPVEKKNRKLRIYIDFMELNRAAAKVEYPMLTIDLLVDAATWHKIDSFIDVNAR